METKKKRGLFYMVLGALVFLVALAVYVARDDSTTSEQPTATSTISIATSTATTTDIFAMEPIVPEAKVSTEGWKTCRNEEYGWEVMYPGDWVVLGAASDNPNDRSLTASGTCSGIGATMSSNIDPGDRERKDFVVSADDRFRFPRPAVYQESLRTLDSLVDFYTDTNQSFALTNIAEQPVVYRKLRSTSLTGGHKINFYMEHPDRGTLKLSFSNIEPDVRDTILSTIHFSTSTGELDHGKLLNAE